MGSGGANVENSYQRTYVRPLPHPLTVAKITPESRIGIAIEPSQVRLIPSADDPYSWKVLPEKKYLFSKNMSDHSISAYKELCGEIGVLFEAVPVESTRTGIGSEDVAQAIFTSAEVCEHLEFWSQLTTHSALTTQLQRENR